ncbi:hypothetical protein H2512_03305 [Pasteurella multocida]|uniref:hypothetical protein n=1 Tax=Pasteurella multocida TaxID=747 RepID=UPI0028782300|nr:hypothetical protein [Pasteurella multocida]WNY74715.1 hypothetical protein H2512_03250 [Pasteurella multocida]WNY74725.1 hypothetical protein H2512_03305 [Pasteurella multocida]HDX0976818.1 hypothetical protein [Pasteurella multocida]
MIKHKIKKFARKATVVGTVALASASSMAEGLADLGGAANFSDGKTAITAVAVGLGGFLVFGLVAKSILGFFKRA